MKNTSFEARKATYLPKFTEDTGTGLISIQEQNLRYIACWLIYVLRVEAAKAIVRNLATSLSNALVTFSLVQGSVKEKEQAWLGKMAEERGGGQERGNFIPFVWLIKSRDSISYHVGVTSNVSSCDMEIIRC